MAFLSFQVRNHKSVFTLEVSQLQLVFLVKKYFVTIEDDDDGTLTVWDGGCRITSKSSAFPEPINEKLQEEKQSAKKQFISNHPRSIHHSNEEKSSRSFCGGKEHFLLLF